MNKVYKNIPTTVDEAVDQIINSISFRERIMMANLKKNQMALLEQLYSLHIREKLKEWFGNKELMKNCLARSENHTLDEIRLEAFIIKELLRRLRETHKLRVIK
jgi:hypothetical protein